MRLIAYVTDSVAVYEADTPPPDAQAALLRSWSEARLHTLYDPTMIENAPARRIADRPLLTSALQMIESKKADGLLIHSFGTLGMTCTEILHMVRQVALLGGHLISVSDAMDSTTPAGLGMVRKLYNLAQCQPAKLRGPHPVTLSDRPKKSRYVPFGWRLGKTSGPWERREGRYKGLEPVRHPLEQVMLQEILDRCDGTGKSAYSLAKEFNGQGRKHPRLKKPWQASNIITIWRSASRYQQDAHTEIAKLALGVKEAS